MTTWQPLPTNKSSELDNLFKMIYGKDRVDVITSKRCMRCDVDDLSQSDFKDDQSLTEYHISGLCQPCQYLAFKE